jgi:8-oxo-dGTP pyrophosphatase MutT (NUDIX family)
MKKPVLPLVAHEISAGGIVIRRRNHRLSVAVIRRHEMKDWTLPKGHHMTGELLHETAIREVLEEAGIHAQPVKYLGHFTYVVRGSNGRIPHRTFRTVHWFLMRYLKLSPRKPDREVAEVKWLSLTSDFSFLTYRNDRLMLKKAIDSRPWAK